ncbi:MAG: hypothetical protein WBL53_07915 [Pseudonocardiaceae bacterium]
MSGAPVRRTQRLPTWLPNSEKALLHLRRIPARLLDALLVVLPGRRVQQRRAHRNQPDGEKQSDDAEHDSAE